MITRLPVGDLENYTKLKEFILSQHKLSSKDYRQRFSQAMRSPDETNVAYVLEVDRISASVSVSAQNVDKWALSADIRFRPKAVVSHSVHFRFRQTAVGKFGGCRK